MEENKKNKFFKGFWGKEKETAPQQEPEETTVAQTEEDSVQQKEPEQDRTAEQNRLDTIYRLYCRWCQYQGKMPLTVPFAEWVKMPVLNKAEELNLSNHVSQKAEIFRRQILLSADKLLRQLEAAEEAARKQQERAAQQEQQTEQEPVKVPPDIDAEVRVQIPMGGMEAFVFVFPPFGDGLPVDEDRLYQELGEAGIASGLHSDLVQRIAGEQLYFQIFLVATGRQPVAGEDGKIIEHIPREEILSFEEDEEGKVNYKDLNLFRNIEKGDVICDIVAPQEGTNGLDVKGNVIKAASGRKADVPAGSNTVISDDGSQLLAASNGYISFEHGKFRVANQLVIGGNVDMSVGNQDFLGDIIVQGDVISGFTLKATGNIYVQGVVEGAVLIADGNIEIGDGMNGNNCGELHAGGSIRSTFLENVKIFAAGDVRAQSMISCETHCRGSIYVDQGIGVIIGGVLTAGKLVKARIIGSKAQRKTEIILGMLPEDQEEKQKKTKELETAHETRALLQKNIQFLQAAESLTQEKAALLKQLMEQEALYGKMEDQMQTELAQIDNKASDYSECMVQCGTVFPPTKITISDSSYSVDTVTVKGRFYFSKEEGVLLGID